MDITDPKIEEYVKNHTTPLPDTLNLLERETQLKVLRPRMLSGRVQGKFLELLVTMSKATHVLEIGTYTGYSAICMANSLPNNGSLHTIDINLELETIARKYFKLANLDSKIKLHIGDAMDIIPQLDINFDFVFMDADKSNYLNYYELLIDQLPSGAWIVADNVLWSGKVLNKEVNNDPETAALQKFNSFIQNDNRVENILLPLRDGLMLIRKK